MRAVTTTPSAPAAGKTAETDPEARRQAARHEYRTNLAHGIRLTGVELARRYGMSERWGRDRIAEARAHTTGNGNGDQPAADDAAGTPNGNGSQPGLPAATDGNGNRPAADDAAGTPNGNGSLPRLPAATDGNGSLPRLPAATDGNGNRPAADDAAGTPSGNGKLPPDTAGRANGNTHGKLPAHPPAGTTRGGSSQPAANGNGNGKPLDLTATGSGREPVSAHGSAAAIVQQRITTAAVVVVALVAGAASYDHQRALAELAGEGWRSLLFPLSVDGLLTAATMLMLTRRRAGQRAGALTWVSLTLGVTASVTGNVIGADPTIVDPVLGGRLVAAWPPVALFLSLELLMRQLGIRHEGDQR